MNRMIVICLILLNSGYAVMGTTGKFSNDSLTTEEISVLDSALQSEYRLALFYDKIVEKFGRSQPYENLLHRKVLDILLLQNIYKRHDLKYPESKCLRDSIPDFIYLEKACLYGKDLVSRNIKMYTGFLKKRLSPELKKTFRELKKYSEENLKQYSECD